VYQEAIQSEFLSALEEDLDDILKIGVKEPTACREVPIFDGHYLDSDDSVEPFMLDSGLQDCVYNVVHTGLGDRTCPIPYLCCTLLIYEVGLVGTEGNYSSCTRVRFLG
jgi:hypothetical protein